MNNGKLRLDVGACSELWRRSCALARDPRAMSPFHVQQEGASSSAGNSFTIRAVLAAVVQRIKKKLQPLAQIPASLQELTFRGVRVENDRTLIDHQVPPGGTLILRRKASDEAGT